MLTVIAIPSFTDFFNATTTSYAQGMFTEFLPWAAVIVGVLLGGLILNKLGKITYAAVKKAIGGGRRGGRRRRY